MLTVSYSQVINQPPAEVFDAAADPKAQLEWDKAAMASFEILTPGPLAQETRVRCRFKSLGTVEYTFSEFDRPHRFTWYSAIPRWKNWHTFDFEEVSEGTRLTQRSSFELNGLWNLAAPVLTLMIKQRLAAMTAGIAAYTAARIKR